MIVKLLTEHHLEFLSIIDGCTDSPESTLAKMPHCWKSHAAAHFIPDEALEHRRKTYITLTSESLAAIMLIKPFSANDENC